MAYTLQFVDSIAASPTVRLDVTASPWTLRDTTDFGMPPLERAVVSTLLADGERYPAAAFGNRMLNLVLRADGASDDAIASTMQSLMRELDRPANILRYQPGTTEAVFFRTFRSSPDSVRWDPFHKEIHCTIPAEPFAYGVKETLSAVTVYNDPAEGESLNANSYFETDASNWMVSGGTIARSTTQAHEGVASLLLTPDGVSASAVARSEMVTVTTGVSYRASEWVRCAVSRSVSVGINWYDASSTFLSTSSAAVSVTADTWTLLDVTATAPASAAKAQITAFMTGTPPSSHTLYVDEARLWQPGTPPGMCFDVTGVKGDMETPLIATIDAFAVVYSGSQSLFAVRRRGNPSGAPFVLQCESMTPGADTTLQANDPLMSGSGQNYLRCDFTVTPGSDERATISTWPAVASQDTRGDYRVFLRVRRSDATSVFKVRLTAGIDGSDDVLGDEVTLALTTSIHLVDLDRISLAGGGDPVFDGFSGTELPVAGRTISLYAQRVSGTGTLDLDCLLFVPADDRMMFVKWPNFTDDLGSTETVTLDGANESVWAARDGAVIAATPGELAGGFPMLSPNTTNRVYFLRAVGTAGNALTGTDSVTVSYWPRYQFVRGVGS